MTNVYINNLNINRITASNVYINSLNSDTINVNTLLTNYCSFNAISGNNINIANLTGNTGYFNYIACNSLKTPTNDVIINTTLPSINQSLIATSSTNAIWDNKKSCIISEILSTGTNGGTFNSGSWNNRNINNITGYGYLNFINISSNKIQLNPSIYKLNIKCPAYFVDNHQIRLYNNTNSSVVAIGSTEFSNTSQTSSILNTILNVSVFTEFYIQHYCSSTKTLDGLGKACGFTNEVYTLVNIDIL